MGRREDEDEYEIPPWLIKAGRLIGLSEVQARWKAMRLLRSLRAMKQDLAPPSSRVKNVVCANCGAWQPETVKRCGSCHQPTTSALARSLRLLGISVPPLLSASILLAAAMTGIYAFMWTRFPREAIGGWSTQTLIGCGANLGALSLHGQWWRLATSMFLHIGVLHIGFNVMALAQIGPAIEDAFGRGRMVFYFMVTGVLASLASALLQDATSAGASGALMGLVGMACGWGQRLGTSRGKMVRDQMLKWGLYVMLFGFVIHADNYAHAAGFIAGAIIGYAQNAEALERKRATSTNQLLGLVGGLAAVATTVLVVGLVVRCPATKMVHGDYDFRDD